MIHEDTRRTLHEWATGEFKTAKVIYVKKQTAIGDHHHNKKDEHFFLAKGTIKELIIGQLKLKNIHAPHSFSVERGEYHKFIMTKGSILFGVTTELYDPADEIR